MSANAFASRPVSWRKLGLIIRPRPELWWMQTHAMIPTVEHISGSLFRVYFSGRDSLNRSHIGYAVLDIAKPHELLEVTSEPVLTLGALGCFDDNGVTPSCVVNRGEEKFLYYIGWNSGTTVRMHLFGGLAISRDDGKTFERYSRAPIIERTRVDPYLNTAPFVLYDDGIWRMYYVSGVEWVHRDLPRYNIKYAESRDGLTWDRRGVVCIDFASPSENALARPCVRKNQSGAYEMWFSHKGASYRVGYATSNDGVHWERSDELSGIDVSPSGWDSTMIEYAFVFEHDGARYLMYNGNDYGRDGIGLAVAE